MTDLTALTCPMLFSPVLSQLQESMNIDLTTNPSDPHYDLTKKRIAEERHRVGVHKTASLSFTF